MPKINILRSGVSVYEVEVDLGGYSSLKTHEMDGFATRLLRTLPTLRSHECYAGESGGFVRELRKGTDLAHVMEHVILELLKMATGCRRRFTGWTRKKARTHVIHFQVPDSSMGRCAAVAAIRLIEDIIEGKRISKQSIIRDIRNSREVESCD
jgi:cyanophycin synthetase